MGRRGVQQLTAVQWREALEQQIQEKEQQREHRRFGGGNHDEESQRRSQSAPQQGEGDGELNPNVPGLERAAMTSTCSGEMDDSQVAGRRRRFQQQQQSREEYLKGLQDQIEEKKQLAQEAQEKEKEQSRRRRMSRSEDDDDNIRRENYRDDCQTESKSVETRGNAKVQDRMEDVKPTLYSNQHEVEPCQSSKLKAEVTADPVAITKIVDFCEELKKQNEDVKRQLSEQHAVLASLHSTLAVEGNGSASVAASRRRNSALRGSVDKSNVKVRQDDMLTASDTNKPKSKDSKTTSAMALPTAPRPRPMRGETKIPLPRSSLRSAGADIVKRLAPEAAAQQHSPLRRAEPKFDPCTPNGSIPNEKRTFPPDAGSKSLVKEELPPSKEVKSNSFDSQDWSELQLPELGAPKIEEKEGCPTTSSEKEVGAASSCDNTIHIMDESSARRVIPEDSNNEDEQPMDAESKLVRNWENEDELLNCSSISILDGPSSLIPLDQSTSQLF